jgi:hypothetical protein
MGCRAGEDVNEDVFDLPDNIFVFLIFSTLNLKR